MCGFENTSPVGSGSFTPTPRAPGMPMALADTYQAAGVDITDPRAFDEDRRALEAGGRWAKENPYDAGALALSSVPVLGDVAGVANDVRTFATDPDSRTPLNIGLSALGALPFVPPVAGTLVDHFPRPSWAKAATDVPMYQNPTREEIGRILQDPQSGRAVALLEDGRGEWYGWRRDNADVHLLMSHDLEERVGAKFPQGEPLNRHTAESVEEAMEIMRNRSIYNRRR